MKKRKYSIKPEKREIDNNEKSKRKIENNIKKKEIDNNAKNKRKQTIME